MKPSNVIGAVVVAILVLVAALYLTGVVRPPSVTIEDEGDWGTVTEERTEVVTTLRVSNPNSVGVSLGKGMSASYRVYLNDVRVAQGERTGIDVPRGTSRLELSSYIENDRIAPWWVAFVRANETLTVRVDGRVRARAFGLTTSANFPSQTRTMLANETPIIDSMSGAMSSLEGTYTKEATIGTGSVSETVTVGYEVDRAWATWGSVNRSTTVMLFHVRLYNPGQRIPMPAAPDGLALGIEMNDVSIIDVRGDAFGVRSVDRDALLAPGETREIVYVATMDNDRVDDWFRSHVERGERSTIEVRTSLAFESPRTGTTIRVPGDGPVTYTCEFQTAMLVDDRTAGTTCGSVGG